MKTFLGAVIVLALIVWASKWIADQHKPLMKDVRDAIRASKKP